MDSSFQSKNFPTTLWTVVLHAGRDEPAQAQAALAQLCQGYWYPLYSFIRRRGYSPHDAQDLTQAFFAHLLEKRGLGRVDPEQGRFRTFLLASLKNFLANDWDKSHALKRGGGQTIVSLDEDSAESRYRLEPSHDLTPERHFERQWAMTLLDQVLDALRDEYHAEGKGDLFEELKAVLTGQVGRLCGHGGPVTAKRRGDQGGRPSAAPPLPRPDASPDCRDGGRGRSRGRAASSVGGAERPLNDLHFPCNLSDRLLLVEVETIKPLRKAKP